MQKRPDLQGIRGIAIFSVLLYHFLPETFKNGYVGVDQFFILSGFLMAEILSRQTALTCSNIFTFYYRPFVSNTKTEDDATYEELLANAQVLFTHTWSLSCEVQFYIIAPFLILLPNISSKGKIIAAISFVSYVVFTYMFESGKQELAFNFMPTRIWQFATGCLCSIKFKDNSTDECEKLIDKDIETESSGQSDPFSGNTILFSLLLLSWFPIEITPLFVRLVVSFETAGLIYTGKISPNKFLSNRYLAYLGDISYSLYLVHWPIRVFMKHYNYTSTIETFLGMICYMLLAALVFETYEKFYLKLEKPGIISLTGVLYLSCLILILAVSPESIFTNIKNTNEVDILWQVPENLTTEAAISLNEDFNIWDATPNKDCIMLIKPDRQRNTVSCMYNNTNFSGDKRILLIGNSYAENLGRLFPNVKECQEKAKEIQLYSQNGCEVLENTGEWASRCTNKTEDFQKIVAKVRPDVLFISVRQMTSMMPAKGDVDKILETEISLLEQLEENVQDKVYILNAIPRHIFYALTNTINNGLRSGKPVSQDSLWDKAHDFMLARKRMSLLAEQCSKCELIDVMPSFMQNGTFQFYNKENGLSYFAGCMHFTLYGLQKILPVYRNVCNNIK